MHFGTKNYLKSTRNHTQPHCQTRYSSYKLILIDYDFNIPHFIFAWFCYPCSFSICTSMYAGVAYMGYTMFGESTETQFTLNLPQDLVVSKVAVWTTVCSSALTKISFSCSVCSLPLI
jgi:hypothetical protein